MYPTDMTSNPYCRLCTLKSENFIDVFHSDGTALELAPKIKLCLQIFLSPEDVLPKTVCVNCCEKVLEYSEFFSMCTKSQLCLLDIFTSKAGENMTQKDIATIDFNIATLTAEDKVSSDVVNQFSEEFTQKLNTIQETSSSLQPQQCEDRSSVAPSVIKTQANSETSILQNILEGLSEEEAGQSSDEDDNQSFDFGTMEKCIWKCATCNEELQSLTALKNHHTNIHSQAPIYKCVQCSKEYERYRSYARHVKTHLAPNKFSCTICGKSFSQKTILQSHSAVHSDIRPHSCVYCGKSFKQFSSLYLHGKCHLPEKAKLKFPCTHCNKAFSSKTNLETHLKIHTGERNFICDVCGKRFFAKSSLDYHISTHTDEKPHNCPTCGKCFKTRRLLSKHTSVHTGVKPHQCDVCGKQFREKGAMREHLRIHTGAMPYSCEFCGKLFRFKGILTVHRRLHTGERPYSCQVCRRAFTNWANYNKHMKRRHGNSVKQRIVEQPSVDTVTMMEPQPTFDPDIAILVNPQYLQPEESFRVSEFPCGSLQLASYYLQTPSVLAPDD